MPRRSRDAGRPLSQNWKATQEMPLELPSAKGERRRAGQLRVGYLVQQFPPEVGAGAARIGEMTTRWASKGVSVTVFTGMPNRPTGKIAPEYRGRFRVSETIAGVSVHRSWLYASPKGGAVRTILNNLSFLVTGAVNSLARSDQYDVIVVSSPPFFPLIAAPSLAWRHRVPIVLEIRDLWPDYLAEMGALGKGALGALMALERYLLQRADLVVTVTEPLRTRIIQKGVAPERTLVMPNGVDTDKYFYDPSPALDGSSTLDGGEERFVVGYLGNFGAGQALDVVIEAASLVAAADPTVELVLAGGGTERERVEQVFKRVQPPNLKLLPVLPREETRRFYSDCDACLVPLAPWPVLAGALPTKLFEILACERPVIAAAMGEIPRILLEAGAGIAAPPGDPNALADAILRLRQMPAADRRSMGERGRDLVKRRYDRRAVADKFLEALIDTVSVQREAK